MMDNIEDMMQEEEDKTPAQVYLRTAVLSPPPPSPSPVPPCFSSTNARLTTTQRKAEYERNKKGSINKSDFMENDAVEEVIATFTTNFYWKCYDYQKTAYDPEDHLRSLTFLQKSVDDIWIFTSNISRMRKATISRVMKRKKKKRKSRCVLCVSSVCVFVCARVLVHAFMCVHVCVISLLSFHTHAPTHTHTHTHTKGRV
jgi:hypothetical protein